MIVSRKMTIIDWCLLSLVFVISLCFFEAAHKLVLFNADDWTYISQTRTALPSLKYWNPARIMPEVFMAGCGMTAAYLIRPICGDLVSSFTIMNGIALSIFITFYVFSFYKLLSNRFDVKRSLASIAAVIFLLLHFWIFRSAETENNYLFTAQDVTCVYFYTIPTLFNASVMMYFATEGSTTEELGKKPWYKQSLILACTYFAVFSNLYSSAVLAVYLGIELLSDIIRSRNTDTVWGWVKRNILRLAVIAMWLISVLFEGLGERADVSEGVKISSRMADTLRLISEPFGGMNRLFVLYCGTVVLLTAVLALHRRKETAELIRFCGKLLCCYAVITVFDILLSAKVWPPYFVRIEVVFSYFVYDLLLVGIAGGYLLRETQCGKVASLMLIAVIISNIICPLKTFRETNNLGVRPELLEEIDRDILNTIVEADRKGLTQTTIEVLYFGEEQPIWPQPETQGKIMSAMLYKYGFLSKPMQVETVVSWEMNEKYGLVS